mgnify:CR=1 FL=1|jgi:N-dimethylarginine dimethylaminohydrolase
MIPIKGYATFHQLKHCLLGKHFTSDYFTKHVSIPKVLDPLKRIADETEEDFQKLDSILKEHGVKTYRPEFDENNFNVLEEAHPPVTPRDHYAVVGETIYGTDGNRGVYDNVFKNINPKNTFIRDWEGSDQGSLLTTANICRVGKDIFWDYIVNDPNRFKNSNVEEIKSKWESEGFRVHISHRGYHSDGSFCVVKPGLIITLGNVQDYTKTFPGWEVVTVPENPFDTLSDFYKVKKKVDGKWWVPGEENNSELINFVNQWLNHWVGYVEETVFDVNMLSINENLIICNNYNKQIFDAFKRHKVEPIVFNFRHRYFWDGGVHCITQDLYREGTIETYIEY